MAHFESKEIAAHSKINLFPRCHCFAETPSFSSCQGDLRAAAAVAAADCLQMKY